MPSEITNQSATAYRDCVMAFAQRRGQGGSVYLTVHGALPLTKNRRLAIGRKTWELANPAMLKAWDDSPEETRLSWSRTHMGRYGNVLVERFTQGGKALTSYTAKNSGGGSIPAEDFHVLALSEL